MSPKQLSDYTPAINTFLGTVLIAVALWIGNSVSTLNQTVAAHGENLKFFSRDLSKLSDSLDAVESKLGTLSESQTKTQTEVRALTNRLDGHANRGSGE